jgi:hypothetical protein
MFQMTRRLCIIFMVIQGLSFLCLVFLDRLFRAHSIDDGVAIPLLIFLCVIIFASAPFGILSLVFTFAMKSASNDAKYLQLIRHRISGGFFQMRFVWVEVQSSILGEIEIDPN